MASRVLGLGIYEEGPHFLGGPEGSLADLLLPCLILSSYKCSVTLSARQKFSGCPSLWGPPLGFPSGVSFQSLSRYSTIHVPGTGDTIILLGISTDPELSSPLENRPSPLGKLLYVVLRVTSSDPDRFALGANEVFASTSIFITGAAKATYDFVKER